ncbi:argininosuccinate synthase [Leptolyngbya sp. 15MV]|nr:argininosuccinate synthase [Leptolyngbya sp. 15MV]
MKKRIALAYSGGLDTSCIVPWLRENIPNCEVVCVVGDVGQGADELAGVEQKARNSGAVECHVVDLRQTFVDEYVMPTVIAGAIYEGRYLLGTAIARPVLAKGQVMPRLVDLFATYLREVRPEELRGSAGTHRLREELIARASLAAAPARVTDVLFVEILVQ